MNRFASYLEMIHVIHPQFLQGFDPCPPAHFCSLKNKAVWQTHKLRSLLHGPEVPRIQAQAFNRTGWWAGRCDAVPWYCTSIFHGPTLLPGTAHTFFETRKTNAIVVSSPEMSNSAELPKLSELGYGSESRFGSGLPKGKNDTLKQTEASED